MNFIKTIKTRFRRTIENTLPQFWFKKYYYSQFGEDVIIKDLIAKNSISKFYVDVGAHDPYRFSNTALLYNQGWKGMNIEPTPTLFKKFLKHRKRDINLNIGISDKSGELQFFQFNEPALNSFDKIRSNEIHKDNSNEYEIIKTTNIIVQSLNDVFEKHNITSDNLGLLTIDAEGLDNTILENLNWEKYSPHILIIESIDQKMKEKLRDEYGYRLHGKTAKSLIYMRT